MGKCPDERERQALLDSMGTPELVRAHCRAVAERAALLARNSSEPVDLELLECACLLHDLCRTQGREHPQRAAEVLTEAGYPELAKIVRQHHDLGPAPSTEAQILYLADKLTAGTEPVTLKERFEAARTKCSGPKALAAWRRRYDESKALAAKFGWESCKQKSSPKMKKFEEGEKGYNKPSLQKRNFSQATQAMDFSTG